MKYIVSTTDLGNVKGRSRASEDGEDEEQVMWKTGWTKESYEDTDLGYTPDLRSALPRRECA